MRAFAILVLGAALLAAPAALADPDAAHPWDATWVGGFDSGGVGVQVIVAGNQVIGLFFHGDYLAVSRTEPLASDGSLSFTFDGGTAMLSGRGDDRNLTVRENGQADRTIKLTEDE